MSTPSLSSLAPPPFAEKPSCQTCQSGFGLFKRKHHCRNCGGTFCNECSSKTIALPLFGIGESVRVCDRCYEIVRNKLEEVGQQRENGGREIQVERKVKREEAIDFVAAVQKKCVCGMPLCICPEEVCSGEWKQEIVHQAAQVISPKEQIAHPVMSRPAYLSAAVAKVDKSGNLNEQAREAIKNGNLKLLQELIALKADVNWVDHQGQSLLHLAAIMNKTDIALFLLEKGACLDAKNGQGETVLDIAAPSLSMKLKAFRK